MSQKDTLTRQDIQQWAQQTVIFCIIPSLIVFLNTVQTGGDLKIALLSAQGTAIGSLINLLGKYKAGSPISEEKKIEIPTPIVEETPVVEPQINS